MNRCKIYLLCLLLLMTLLFSSCTASVSEDVLWHMDTAITLRIYGEQSAAASAIQHCNELLGTLDEQLSATDPKSPVYAFNAASDDTDTPLPAEAMTLLEQAFAISAATGGAFDVTVAPLISLWDACEAADALPTDGQLAAALSLVGREHITLTEQAARKDRAEVCFDLGGIGKGYAAERVRDELKLTKDVTAALVSFGSNVAVVGEKPNGEPWRIALRDPNTTEHLGYIHLTEEHILSVSGDYERYFTIGGKQYSHILDPQTGYPPKNGLRSVAVLCPDGATADALSTALMVMGEDAARELHKSGTFDFEAVFIYDDRVEMTAGITLH